MPRVGLEPTRAFAHTILSRARKPIPPPRHVLFPLSLIISSQLLIVKSIPPSPKASANAEFLTSLRSDKIRGGHGGNRTHV